MNVLDSSRGDGLYASLGWGSSVGRPAFLTGTPHRMTAACTADSLLGVLSRPDFDRLLQESMAFTSHICERLQHPELISYLQEREELTREHVVAWVATVRQALMETRHLPDAVFIDRHLAIFTCSGKAHQQVSDLREPTGGRYRAGGRSAGVWLI